MSQHHESDTRGDSAHRRAVRPLRVTAGSCADESGAVREIVEERDASPAQREINESNSSVYAFDAEFLAAALAELGRDNAQDELYLTDVVKIARGQGRSVRLVPGR